MGEGRRAVCGCIFLTKASLAFIIGLGGLVIQTYLIWSMHKDAVSNKLPSVEIPLTGCPYNPTSALARLEPPDGKFLFGFHIQWDVDKPQSLVGRLGRRPAIFNAFVKMNNTDFERDMIAWHAEEAGKVGAMLEISLDLSIPIEQVTNEALYSVARHMRLVNSKFGVPVFLRWCHEMNGPWMTLWGMKPTEYRQTFITLASYVRSLTNMTAMVFSPNIGVNYPFRGGGYDGYIPSSGERLRLLDTNGDGTVNVGDDPYMPYWPGDEWVDWVGISVYNYNQDANGQTAPATSQGLVTGVQSYYDRFSTGYRKPFLLSETGSSFQYDAPGSPYTTIRIDPNVNQQTLEVNIKESWWKAILANANGAAGARFPNLKAAVWFEELKNEQSYTNVQARVMRDYRITYNTSVRNTFLSDMDAVSNRVAWSLGSSGFKFACDGSVQVS